MRKDQWEVSDAKVFWGEIPPSDHLLQIYEDEDIFIDLLTGFVTGGFRAGDCVIVIATDAHLEKLNAKLKNQGLDLFQMKLSGQYLPLSAAECLTKFMVDNHPDENLFRHFVRELLMTAKGRKRPLRAFGEMVALLWADGHKEATIELEQLWNQFCDSDGLRLFCAYPKALFSENEPIMHICGNHTKMVTGFGNLKSKVSFRRLNEQRSA